MSIRIVQLLGALFLATVFATPAAAWRLPMYQTYHPYYQDYFYTTDASQRDLAISYGYYNYGIAFYVDDGSTGGSTPLQRFYMGPPQTDHFYTSDSGEVNFVMGFGYAYERTEGYVFNYQAPGTVPIYRAAHFDNATSDLMHFYTPDYNFWVSLGNQGWGLDSTIFYAYTTGDPPPPTPVMVHATHLTASCADRYCVKITGYNFAPNSYVEMRQTSATGPIIGTTSDFVRGMAGPFSDAQTIEINFPYEPLHTQLDHPGGIWFYVVNPGNPTYPAGARGGGLNVIRDSGSYLRGWVEDKSDVILSGWMCTDANAGAPVQYVLRDGSDSGEIVVSGTANLGARGDIANVCGGNANRSFQLEWPSKWRDGVARHAYLIGNIGPGFYRYPNALVPGAPIPVQLPYDPWDSLGTPTVQTINVARGAPFSASFTFTNKGSATWDTNVSVAQTGTLVPWVTPDSLGLNANIPPDGVTRSFTVGGTAPTTAGSYPVRYRVRYNGAFFGAFAFINVNVQ